MRYLSLFSGMEAAHLAWAPLGWETVAVAEIDPSACALLRHRLPGVPNLGSVTEITDEQIAALGPIDVVIGGSPCQDLSVAGKRKGLAGARSGLFHEQLRIFDAARHLCGARWLVWENVPGAFSSNRGRDFAVVVGAMAGLELAVPEDGWGNEGLAAGPNGLVEWSVLDAQWFGVAQRRRRVFAVLDTGNWADRPPVLLEPESLRGDSPPRREAWEGIAAGAEARAVGGGEAGAPGAGARWPAEVACTLNAAFGSKQGLEDQHALGGGSYSSLPPVSMCLNAGAMGRQDAESETLIPTIGGGFDDVAHTLRADGFDASEDGTGRGTPLVPVCTSVAPTLQARTNGGGGLGTDFDCDGGLIAFAQNQRDEVREMEVAGALAAEPGMKQQTYIAFSCKDHGADAGDVSPTLRSMGHDGSHANAGGQVAVAVSLRGRDGGGTAELGGEVGSALRASQGGGDKPHVLTEMAVRRLTPRECERLQGAPDDWTLVPNAKGKPMADGPRYKMLGNSFAVPVIQWIGRQIERAHRRAQLEAAE